MKRSCICRRLEITNALLPLLILITQVPIWFTALETHGPFPGPLPHLHADEYLDELTGGGGGGSQYQGNVGSPRSVYGGSTFSTSGKQFSRSTLAAGLAGAGGGGGGGGGGGSGSLMGGGGHKRMLSDVSVRSGLGLGKGNA